MHIKTYGRNLISALAAAMLFAAAPVSGIGIAGAQEANVIVMKNFDFSPMSLTVKAGTSVTWQNMDGEPHTVTSVDGLFRSGALDQNDKYTFKFAKPGIYKYVCSIHPKMRAAIIVK
jgi:plastocyanin